MQKYWGDGGVFCIEPCLWHTSLGLVIEISVGEQQSQSSCYEKSETEYMSTQLLQVQRQSLYVHNQLSTILPHMYSSLLVLVFLKTIVCLVGTALLDLRFHRLSPAMSMVMHSPRTQFIGRSLDSGQCRRGHDKFLPGIWSWRFLKRFQSPSRSFATRGR